MPRCIAYCVPEGESGYPVVNRCASDDTTPLGNEGSNKGFWGRHACLLRDPKAVAELGKAEQAGSIVFLRIFIESRYHNPHELERSFEGGLGRQVLLEVDDKGSGPFREAV